MPERRITSIIWRQSAATRIELVLANGETETITGTHAEAAAMAKDAEMRLVSSPLGMARWTLEQPTKGGRSPKRIGPWLST